MIFFDWMIQSKNLTFRLDHPVEKLDFLDWICQSKTQPKKLYTCFFNPSHRSSHHKTHPHAHTPIPGTTQQYHTTAPLAITATASRRKSAWRTPSSTRQQRVSYDSSSARYRCHFANYGYACCSFGGSRLSATPRT